MAAPHAVGSSIVNLDDPASEHLAVVFTYKGLRVAIDRHRLEQLLQLEQAYLSSLVPTSRALEAPPAAPTLHMRPRQLPTETVTHASLSSRVTKIHRYSYETRVLRPAHAGILGEMLEAFDWVIPEHANGRLSALLTEISEWGNLPPELAQKIEQFLKQYDSARLAG